jgi:outer membrane receptor for ferrienterochelin and colicins
MRCARSSWPFVATHSVAPRSPSRRPLRNALSTGLALAFTLPAFADAGADAGAATLDRVVVTAAGFEQAERQAPASISVITRSELETRPYHGLAEALADVEGVDVDLAWDKTGAPSISIRGMPADYTLILIDGRRQNAAGNVTPNGFGGTGSNFIPPMSAIERIEVIRGPMSTLYGSDAMGGVVNIITRKSVEQWRGSLGIDTQLQDDDRFGNTHSLNFYAGGPLLRDAASLAVWGGAFDRAEADIRYVETDGDEVVPWMAGNPVAYDNFNFGTRLNIQPAEGHELWLEATRNRQTYDNSTGQLGTLGTGGYLPEQRYHRDQFSLAWNADFRFGQLETTLMQNNTETLGRTIPPGVAGAGQPRNLEAQNQVLDAKLINALGAHVFTLGGQWWEAELVDGVVSAPFAFRQWALFGEDEWSLRENLKFTLGLRHDDHSTFGGETSPRAYLVWEASPQWVIKGGISRGFKTPRVEQLTDGINGFGGQGRIPLIGTPSLTPETSTSTELAALYVGESGFEAGLIFFNNEFDDKIASGIAVPNCSFAASPNRPGCVDVGNWPLIDTFGQSINIDEAVTRGVEANLRLPLLTGLRLETNATFTDSEQKSGASAGQPLVNTPELIANAALRWQALDSVELYLRSQYRGARYRGAGLAQDQLGDYKPYTVHHLGAQWRIREGVSLNAALYNLFDKNFIDYVPYVSNLSTGVLSYSNTRLNNDDGRRLWLSLTVEF